MGPTADNGMDATQALLQSQNDDFWRKPTPSRLPPALELFLGTVTLVATLIFSAFVISNIMKF
jgi:hypothetical protein